MRARQKTLIASAFLTVLLGMTLGATPASAHDELISSSPANGTTLAAVPASVVLTFEEAPADGYTKIKVLDPTGASVTNGSPNSSGAIITQRLRPVTTVGRYTVDWSVLSDDGHPVAGSFAFIVTNGSRPASSSAAAAPNAQTGGGHSLAWLVAVGAGVVVLSCGIALARTRRRET